MTILHVIVVSLQARSVTCVSLFGRHGNNRRHTSVGYSEVPCSNVVALVVVVG